MQPNEIVAEFKKVFDEKLANDLINEFLELKKDYQTGTLSRASAGKFIETVVQILEHLETGSYTAQPAVDNYLKNLESRQTSLIDDLKICLARIARATYTLRNKRNILHKGVVDPNLYDLGFIYSSAQWILTEFVKEYITSDIHKAGEIIQFIQIPVSKYFEKLNDLVLIHANCTVPQEFALVLYSAYPGYLSYSQIQASLERRSKPAISNALKKLWELKQIHKDDNGYKLTQAGFVYAQEILRQL
jgi:hypothetical protein